MTSNENVSVALIWILRCVFGLCVVCCGTAAATAKHHASRGTFGGGRGTVSQQLALGEEPQLKVEVK
jgi:hypothetical protein